MPPHGSPRYRGPNGPAEISAALNFWRGVIVSDFTCDQCKGPAGLMVQGVAFAFRCSKCDAPGAGSLMEFIAARLQSNYKAVLLSRSSKELSVVAEGIGTEILPLVLAAAADGKFVWMKPQ